MDASSVITILDSGPNTGTVKIGGNGSDSVVLVGGGSGISPVIRTDASISEGALVIGASTRNPYVMYVSDTTSVGSGNVTITNGQAGKAGIQLTGSATTNSIHPNNTGTSLRLGAASDISNNIVLTSTDTTVNRLLKVASVSAGATNQLQLENINGVESRINQTIASNGTLQLGSSVGTPAIVVIKDVLSSGFVDITQGNSVNALRIRGGTNTTICPNSFSSGSLRLGGGTDVSSNIVLTSLPSGINTTINTRAQIGGGGAGGKLVLEGGGPASQIKVSSDNGAEQLNIGVNTTSYRNITLAANTTTLHAPVALTATSGGITGQAVYIVPSITIPNNNGVEQLIPPSMTAGLYCIQIKTDVFGANMGGIGYFTGTGWFTFSCTVSYAAALGGLFIIYLVDNNLYIKNSSGQAGGVGNVYYIALTGALPSVS